ncbi:hypothetical protein OOK41_09105 [Micromonospora sp. NBC_01655]|uniref:VG15 protein n=1 Tax=Micromonospora sp. NBC_01655 TaxID=2975983 RepID=UPI00224D3187|nr:ADP-ribosyltransferase [Micromonospora sp. NBC_01655]MCX4470463.1 hypothetical protein [Micromonospora sp. NBC_01655]
MSTPVDLADDHARYRRRLAVAAAGEAGRLWRLVDPARIGESWLGSLARLLVLLTGAQQAVAARADGYLDEVLDAQGMASDAAGRVSAQALAGVASDGRDLADLLYRPVISALVGIKQGATVERAMAGGAATLDMIVRTQVADAGRVADQVAMVARPAASGYVRMLVGRSCSRCVVLAGRRYRWNAGFDRHPRCDCVHVPAAEDTADEIRTNPRAYFDSLTADEQDRAFTKAGAEAIRLGGDLGQVVNARRGARGLSTAGARVSGDEAQVLRGGRDRGRLEAVDVYGRRLLVTTEGVTVRGVAGRRLGGKTPRLMPESILQIAGDDRAEAVRLLTRFGYITDRPSAAPTARRDPVPARPAAAPTHAERWAAGATGQDALDAVPAGLARRAERGDVVLSRSQRDALREYESSYYAAINGQLRSGEVGPRVRRIVDRLDAGMAASRARRDLAVWRGITNGQRLFGDRLDGDLGGFEWREDAYLSTSAEERVAKDFTYQGAGGANSVVMRLVAPARVGAMHVSGTLGFGQAEVLLERGLRLRVVRDRGVSPAGYRLLDVEVLR